MSSTAAFLASFASILIGAAIGMGLKRFLPADVLEGGSKEAIRLGAGFLSTLAALVIGLMIASAKNSYDTQNTNIRQLGANVVLVDQMLLKYGPETKTARTLLRELISTAASRIWLENAERNRHQSTFAVSGTADRFYNAVEGLTPANDEQTSLKVAHRPGHHRDRPNPDTRLHAERQRDPGAVLHRAYVLAGGDFCKLQRVRRTEADRGRVHSGFRTLRIERAVPDRRPQPAL